MPGLCTRASGIRGLCTSANRRVVLGCRLRRIVLAKAEVQQMYVTFRVEDNIVGLNVTVNVLEVGVDVVHSLDKLRYVEARLIFAEGVLPHQVSHEVTAREVVHHHIEELVVLKGVVQTTHPVVLGHTESVSFSSHMMDLILVHHLLLAHLFHGKNLAGALLPAQPDNAESSGANHLEQFEVVDCHLLPAFPHILVLLPAEALSHGLLLRLREGKLLEMLAQLMRLGVPLLEVLFARNLLALNGLFEGFEPYVGAATTSKSSLLLFCSRC
mmetsp:Transcript_53930/g.116553  ORF Transcript_53930/g.116553 Transcript_53930/m.116553 type:complete len:270 (-) Transcript_53930:151-960(-)